MSIKKRRDSKGRVLRNGESQRKDGRYRFSYYENGKPYCFYSWKLEPNDKIPEGKRNCVALRIRIQEYQRTVEMYSRFREGDMTVFELVMSYFQSKNNIKVATRKAYGAIIKKLEDDSFCERMIRDIRTSDAKLWVSRMQSRDGLSFSYVRQIICLVKPAFQSAVEDDLIPKNPFAFSLARILTNDIEKRNSLSPEDEKRFLDYIRSQKHMSKYYDGIYILLNTGLRISEFCGLIIDDIDFEKGSLKVCRQLLKDEAGELMIETPKSISGKRTLPLSEEVMDCFRTLIGKRAQVKKEIKVQNVSGFLCLRKDGLPMDGSVWQNGFNYIEKKYNESHEEKLPHITPHVCRHTYCTKMAKAGISPKTLQYLMGHNDIQITLNTYTHFRYDDASAEMKALDLI